MARQKDRRKHSEWQKRLQRFTKSGLTVAGFCARERVAVATFWYWRRKCSGQAPDSKALAPTFAPVDVIGGRVVTLRFPAGAVLELPVIRRFKTGHVIPALIRKCEEARLRGDQEIVCWGTGKATREFLYVDDAAEGIVRAAEVLDVPTPVNLGGGEEIAIAALVRTIADACGFTGSIRWDATKPDGQPRSALHTSRARQALGWHAKTSFSDGLRATVEWWRTRGV